MDLKIQISTKNIKKVLVSGLVLSLLAVSGCFGLGKNVDATREFFQLIADGNIYAAYESTADVFKENTSYEDFIEIVEYAELDSYVDFSSNEFVQSTQDGDTVQILYGDWSDSYGYSYEMEVYWLKVDDGWELVGFYFVE